MKKKPELSKSPKMDVLVFIGCSLFFILGICLMTSGDSYATYWAMIPAYIAVVALDKAIAQFLIKRD